MKEVISARRGRRGLRRVAVLATSMLMAAAAVAVPAPARADPIPVGLVSGAFQASTGILWTLSPSGVATSTGLAMRTSSSPSVRTTYHGVAIAFQANTGVLSTWSNGVARSTGLAMKHGTSPRGTAEPGDAIAFQGYDGFLWTYHGGIGRSTGLRMKPATSPDILPDAAGGFWIAFQADTGELWVVSPSGVARSTGRRMRAGTSPALTRDDSIGTLRRRVPGRHQRAVDRRRHRRRQIDRVTHDARNQPRPQRERLLALERLRGRVPTGQR